jgi:hypothetical protein
MSRVAIASFLPLALAIGACNKNPGVPADAQKTAAALSGDSKGSAESNPLCKKFTRDEIASYEGGPVNEGQNAAMGSGCQWIDERAQGSAILQVVSSNDHSPPSAAAGYKELPAVGEQGFVAPEMGGWHAGAIQGGKSINVLTGSKSDELKTVVFLKEAMKRAGG